MKSLRCAQVRNALLRPGSEVLETPALLDRHLERCPACADFAERARLAVESLGARRSAVIADSSFAARVHRALPEAREDFLGWALLRVLPASVALSLVLGIWSWNATGTPSTVLEEAPTDDLISWVLEESEDS